MASTNKYDVFLSFDWLDHNYVMVLADKLRAQNIKVFLDRWYLRPDSPWPQELDRILSSCASLVICIGSGEMDNWQQREVYFALEKRKSDADFPVLPLLLPGAEPALGLLSLDVWIDLRQGLDQSLPLTMLSAIIRRRPLGSDFQQRIKETKSGLNPYKGLTHFREEDASFYYGREEAITKLTEIIRRNHFAAVVGDSGSGKSSLVRAGLIPALRKEVQESWEILTIVPGDRPLYNLTSAFVTLLYPGLDDEKRSLKIAEHQQALEKQPAQVKNWINLIRKSQLLSGRFLLVVDQWEELYALQPNGDNQEARDRKGSVVTIFIEALLAATEAGIFSVVLAIRSDFMTHAISHRPLTDRLMDSQLNLGPMRRQELQRAIEKPAEQAGSGFEDGLVESMLNDVAANSGSLPLLEFALQRLWNDPERRGGNMRQPAYTAMQGLAGALIRTADEAYRTLSDQDQKIAQLILVELVQTGEDMGDISRRVSISKFGAEALPVIKHLMDQNLLVIKKGLEEGQDTVELAHETLIRQWRQLRSWLIDDRQFNSWRAKLDLALEKNELLEKHRLREARLWRLVKRNQLYKSELDFIAKSYTRTIIQRAKLAAAVLLPTGLAAAFAFWVGTEELLSPKLGVYVLLAQAGVTYFIEPEMVDIPSEEDAEKANALSFLMGSKTNEKDADIIERPQHRVTINKPFHMSQYEITFDQYQVFAYLIDRDGGCADKHKIETSRVQDEHWGRGKRPAINVSWSDATCYAQWLSKITGVKNPYRLPTEAEWEYAARAGTESVFWWGSAMEQQMAVCDGCRSDWQGKSERKQTAEVNDPGFKPNAWGLYHTSGNVWEWVQDCWHDSYYSAPADGSAWLSQNNGNCGRHVLRGGSWVDTPVGLRSAHRYKLNADYRYYNVGFRLAQD